MTQPEDLVREAQTLRLEVIQPISGVFPTRAHGQPRYEAFIEIPVWARSVGFKMAAKKKEGEGASGEAPDYDGTKPIQAELSFLLDESIEGFTEASRDISFDIFILGEGDQSVVGDIAGSLSPERAPYAVEGLRTAVERVLKFLHYVSGSSTVRTAEYQGVTQYICHLQFGRWLDLVCYVTSVDATEAEWTRDGLLVRSSVNLTVNEVEPKHTSH